MLLSLGFILGLLLSFLRIAWCKISSTNVDLPEITKNFKFFTDQDSVEAQTNAFIEGINTMAGQPITKGFYDFYIANNDEVKTNMAQSFGISTEQLDEFVNKYIK